MGFGAYHIGAINELVHVELAPTFEFRLECMLPLWKDVQSACALTHKRHVLLEGERPARAMNADDAEAHGNFLAGIDGPVQRVALCLYDYEPDELTRTFVRRANGGRLIVQVFDDLATALRWLGA
jgi:hypothetical protein